MPGSTVPRPKSTFIVTVTTEHYLDVEARDEDHARKLAERRMISEIGTTRAATITNIEQEK